MYIVSSLIIIFTIGIMRLGNARNKTLVFSYFV